MVNGAINEFDMTDYDTPFELLNDLVTDMLGSDEKIELFKPYKNIKPTTENVDTSYVTGHRKYTKIKSNYAARLIYTFTPINDEEIFVYFPSEYKRDAKLKVNGTDLSEYFTNETCRIVSLGRQPAGEELIVSLGLSDDELYIGSGVDYFYYIDHDLFCELLPKLQQNQYEIESFTESHFVGHVTATEEKSLFFLTIPYDKGWHVYIDGEEAETVKVLDALTAVTLTAGEHTVEMRYFPDAVKYGLIISGCSFAVFLAVLSADIVTSRRRKNTAVQEG